MFVLGCRGAGTSSILESSSSDVSVSTSIIRGCVRFPSASEMGMLVRLAPEATGGDWDDDFLAADFGG